MQAEVKQVIKDYSIWYVLAHAQAEIILRQKVACRGEMSQKVT